MNKPIIPIENIILNKKVDSKEEAIRQAGQILVDGGYVNEDYIKKMFEREEITSTFMGNSIAIPHGTEDAKSSVHASGISILQLAEPVDYGNGNQVKMVFGIAGKDNEHLEILSKIAIVCSDEENIEKMVNAKSKEELLSLFSEVE
ncbi:PTS sugar transporter subunit IIA [Salipaludibacillus aurantiacus]|uniref:Mannitol-specific phosphotransferase enzyme IIA component n=1 Tax=Salipaludibacillus aurantiacus TaxID=1601833 RepID=A0A1H9V1Q5_9BACI|nr:PTS sugar transporter subunit IIA [Salipaludibacillus aurantiacus]SES15656.1 PTS system, mannitol-specific IIA component [Salipaludibacillus aurantiacus]